MVFRPWNWSGDPLSPCGTGNATPVTRGAAFDLLREAAKSDRWRGVSPRRAARHWYQEHAGEDVRAVLSWRDTLCFFLSCRRE
jgi:hypothetical protein